MANSVRGEVHLELAGRQFTLKPSFESIIEIESRLGGVVALALRASKGDYGLKDITTVIWCTLSYLGADKPSYENIGQMVLEAGLVPASHAMKDILTAILGGGAVESGSPEKSVPLTGPRAQ